MNAPAKRKFWGIIHVASPFRLGGPPETPYRYAVMAEEVKLLKYRGFVYQEGGEWRVHETTSGGLMCSGKTKDEATKSARELIKITPDFGDQIKSLKPATAHEEITYARAMEFSEKAKDKDKNPADMLAK